jgi:hypothetical protein
MANIFAPLVRQGGVLPVQTDSGPIIDGIEYMHMWVTSDGKLNVSLDEIHHYGHGLPFDVHGRLVISADTVVRVENDVPFTASNAVAMSEGIYTYIDQGVPFLATGHIVVGDIDVPPTIPVWSTIPDTENYQYELAQTYDVAPYVFDGGDPITGYALLSAPVGFSIDGFGLITAAVGAPLGPNLLDVEATNSIGSAFETFTWTIVLGNVPTWEAIPNQVDRVNTLPQVLDIKGYAASDSGPITAYNLVTPPPGFTISNGVITASVLTAVGSYAITVQAVNGVGAGNSSPFTWDILEELVPPIWTEIPDQIDVIVDLPAELSVVPYVTTNSGSLRNWTLITPPPGFTIDQAGLITCAAGTAIAIHSIVVQVENDEGTSSTGFSWTISAELLAPVWSAIAPQITREDSLPTPYDISGFVSSNSGPLTGWALVTPPAGFTIDPSGVITAAAGIAVGTYALTVEVTNDTGTSSSAPFQWEITLFFTAPVWETIPPQTISEELLPDALDVTPYVTSNHGPLTGWTLIAPPAGFSINGSGVISVAIGTPVGGYAITVEVSNDTGTTQSDPFQWTIELFYLPPQWGTIPPQVNGDDELPTTLDVVPYVTTNSGPLTTWELVTPPTGFSIDVVGVITVAAGTAELVHNVTVRVSNNEGSADSPPFTWTITDVLVPPVWSTIPDQSTSEQLLPDTLDLNGFVSSNDGPLTGWVLTQSPAGFSISTGGVVTVVAGTAPGNPVVRAQVTNASGSTQSNAFTWTIGAFYTPPVWSQPSNRTDPEDILPKQRSVDQFVTSNNGPLFGYSYTVAQTWFTIDENGDVVALAGAPPAVYTLAANVSNASGQSTSPSWTWTITSVYLPPQWSTIPAQSTEEQLLPVVLDVKPYVTSNHGSLVSWSLPGAPSGYSIDSNGIITVASGRPLGAVAITVSVSNDTGSGSSTPFTWTILEEPLVPQWSTIPGRQDRENNLPQNYDVSGYVTTNSGALTGWTLVAPPTGFTISGAGVITAAAGTTVAAHSLTVRVSNDEGSNDSAAFIWEVQEELLAPQWSTVPNQSDRINTLPQTLDTSNYVTSNAGTLILYRFDSAPSGFSISSTSGVITANASAGVAVHSLRVGVTNSIGESLSNTFSWTILEELLPPQWSTIPNQTTDDTDLPDTLNVAPYVTSNSGALDTWSLPSAPAGYTITQAGVITAATNSPREVNNLTVRVYNDEGFSDKSFTWEVVSTATSEYLQEFNADLGYWNFYRGSSAWGYDKDYNPRQVSTDVPIYVGCGWSGSAFTPDTGFLGIRIDFESTNHVRYNYNYTLSGWTVSDSAFTANTWSPSNSGANSFGYRIEGGTDDIVMSLYGEVEVAGNWASLAISPDGVIGEVIDESPGIHRTVKYWTSQAWTYPMVVTGGGSTGRLFLNWMQIEKEGATGPTGPIQTGSTSVTRDQDGLSVANTDIPDWSANDLINGFCGQVKFRAHIAKGTSTWLQLYCIVSEENDPGETNYFSIWMSTSQVRAAVYVGSTQTDLVSINHVLVPEGDYDMRWKVDPGGEGVKLWFKGPGIDTGDSNSGTPNLASNSFLVHKWGNWFNTTQTGSNSTTLQLCRLVKEPLSDSEIEGWS